MGLKDRLFGAKRSSFPPIPEWKPRVILPFDAMASCVLNFAQNKVSFVMFKHGTFVPIKDDCTDEQAPIIAKMLLDDTFHHHPDMTPLPIDNGNLIVLYRTGVLNCVMEETATAHRRQIEANHLKGIAQHEILLTPKGPNQFDFEGQVALFGRCFFFMDAQEPVVSRIIRCKDQS